MALNGIIISIDKANNIDMISVLFYEKKGSEWKFSKQLAPEQSVIKALESGKIKLDNATVEQGKLKGTTGDLKRFSGVNKPLVILSEIHHAQQGLIGYRVSTSEGVVKTVRLKDIYAYARRRTTMSEVPFQNGMYVKETPEKSEFIRSYLADGFKKEIIVVRKNEYSEEAKVNIKSNEKAVNKLDELFTKEQQEELLKGKRAGVDIRIYANNKLTPEQMSIIREGLQDGLPMRIIADPAFNPQAMKIYAADMKYGYDVTQYLNPRYTAEQILEVSLGYIDGVDVSKYSDPKNTPETMTEIRLRLTHDIWKEENAPQNGEWI